MIFETIKSFFSKTIVLILGLGLIISLGVGSDLFSFGMSQKIIAQVDGEDITVTEFNYFRNLKISKMPKNLLQDKELMKLLDKEVVATIASRKSLSFKAKELGLRVNNSELKDKIKNSYLFQQNGNFIGFKEYENKVRNIFGLKVEIFENILYEEILNDKLEQYVSKFLSISDGEVIQSYSLESTKMNFYLIKIRPNKSEVINFTEKEIELYKKNYLDVSPVNQNIFQAIHLDYLDFTKDIMVSSEDIANFVANYGDFEDKDESKVIEAIRKRIAENLFSQKLAEYNDLASKFSFKAIIDATNTQSRVEKIRLDLPGSKYPRQLLDEVLKSNFKINEVKVFVYQKDIWIISPDEHQTEDDDYILKKMELEFAGAKQEELLGKLVNTSSEEHPSLFEEAKISNNYLYEFNYDVKLTDFQDLIGQKVDFKSIKEGEFYQRKLFGKDEKYVIYIERIRKANKEFLSLDEDRIKQKLFLDKKSIFYLDFSREVLNKSAIRYNDKYFN